MGENQKRRLPIPAGETEGGVVRAAGAHHRGAGEREAEAIDHVGLVVVAHARVTIGVERQTACDSLLLCQLGAIGCNASAGWRKVGDVSVREPDVSSSTLISLALPRGLEPLFSP